jgi:DNA-directed RNA polymerase subunit RPC12/RpoP
MMLNTPEENATDMIHDQEILCPRCKENTYTPYEGAEYVNGVSSPFPALSRRDNKTYICSSCGEAEAFEDMGWQQYDGPVYWEEAK